MIDLFFTTAKAKITYQVSKVIPLKKDHRKALVGVSLCGRYRTMIREDKVTYVPSLSVHAH